jgi:MFS family permease
MSDHRSAATPIGTRPAKLPKPRRRSHELSDALGLNRNTLVTASAMLLMALGESLWRRFIPKYLQALGAPIVAIGAYGSTEDLLDGFYQYPGGWAADRYGRRVALLAFVSVALIGYIVLATAPAWPIVFVGLLLIMAWTSMASPTLFAVIGDALPPSKRAIGFSIQAILRRVPVLVAPTLGGLLIATYGIRSGTRIGLGVSTALALVTLIVVSRLRLARPVHPNAGGLGQVWRSLPGPLRRLLFSDVLIRTCDALVDIFLVLYALNVVGIDAPRYGVLVAVQMATTILVSIPASRIADRTGRKPFVIATFLAFALFPVAVAHAHSFAGLVAAFVVGGLREIGEPARKALILDLVPADARARSVGLYYLVRSVAIAPAATLGGLLWKVTPALPFAMAGAVGLVGTVVFAITVDERYAG